MYPELSKLLVTVIFTAVLIIMFLWLLKMLPVFNKNRNDSQMNDFEMSGYETMDQIQRKERGVMVLGGLIIFICLLFFGGLIYGAIITVASGSVESENILNLAMVFIPAVFLLVLVVKASSRYIKTQQKTLKEFRRFQSDRRKALAEYEKKRQGSESARQKAAAQVKENPKREALTRKPKKNV